MFYLTVDNQLCANCLNCLAQQVCRVRALLRIDDDEPPYVDIQRCRGCRICLSECPSGAIKVQ